ncbi:uncharacterized protein LOC129235139 [Uloborus diversus]|uniref:uncharacterized protein LOC129235139 n=1 Tax=Uloborus diversus TaxID=327109 RepID=UPI0024091A82|nr:uncharacterized protein LOC129235139 [Uloborus diversus]
MKAALEETEDKRKGKTLKKKQAERKPAAKLLLKETPSCSEISNILRGIYHFIKDEEACAKFGGNCTFDFIPCINLCVDYLLNHFACDELLTNQFANILYYFIRNFLSAQVLWKMLEILAAAYLLTGRHEEALLTVGRCYIMHENKLKQCMDMWRRIKKDALRGGHEKIISRTMSDILLQLNCTIDVDKEIRLLYEELKICMSDRSCIDMCLESVEILKDCLKENSADNTLKLQLSSAYFWLYQFKLRALHKISDKEAENALKPSPVRKDETKLNDCEDENDICNIKPAFPLVTIAVEVEVTKILDQALEIWSDVFNDPACDYKKLSEVMKENIVLELMQAAAETYATIVQDVNELKMLVILQKVSENMGNKEYELLAGISLVNFLVRLGYLQMASKILNHIQKDVSLLDTSEIDSEVISVKFDLAKSNFCFHSGELSYYLSLPIAAFGDENIAESLRTNTAMASSLEAMSLYKALLKHLTEKENCSSVAFSTSLLRSLLKSYLHLGELYRECGEPRFARCYLQEGLHLAESMLLTYWSSKILIVLAQVDLLCDNTTDCLVKINGLKYINDKSQDAGSLLSEAFLQIEDSTVPDSPDGDSDDEILFNDPKDLPKPKASTMLRTRKKILKSESENCDDSSYKFFKSKNNHLGVSSAGDIWSLSLLCTPKKNWTVVQVNALSTESSTMLKKIPSLSKLIICQYRLNTTPVIISTDSSSNTRLNCNFLAELGNILGENALTMKSKDSKLWWTTRSSLDMRLKHLAHDMENIWLGCWKGLFLGIPTNEERIQQLCSDAAHELFLSADKKLLQVLLDSASFLTREQLSAAVCHLWNCSPLDEVHSKLCNAIRNISYSLPETERHPVILILDKDIQSLPWECMPVLNGVPVSRMPSLSLLSYKLSSCNSQSTLFQGLDDNKTFYILNPSGDLKNTQKYFQEKFEKQSQWLGIVGKVPENNEYAGALQDYDFLLYCGHGSGKHYLQNKSIDKLKNRAAALLMGCSSGRLNQLGRQLEAHGIALRFLLSGCPCVVGNLWDVTDKDIDRFMEKLIQLLMPNYEESHTSVNICKAASLARNVCKMSYLVGAAPVVYGFPVFASNRSDKNLSLDRS